ncbi:response regulator transcription factor [Cupriavidus basilensis]|uniref:Response regulator transcription factor n=1 Tax=Cupriavidus basilensis TaxID=68895 RepID=A0ABT6AL38_9BURK|nr:response regulator transcription factor [Cupriavidus basilensis]MDF3833310.1 response regulator transcription factor [Cupriavidus basilensis]
MKALQEVAAGPRHGPVKPVVYIVDDDGGVRVSLKFLLESVGLTVCAYTNGREFLDAADPKQPGCMLLDVRMPYIGGFELQEALASRGFLLPVIFLTAHGDIPMTVRAMKGGAYDFLEKPFNDQALIDKVQAALQLAERRHASEQARDRTRHLLDQLSAREREVFDKLVEGKASKVIASELDISYKTVEVHRAHIREKLGATSLAELVRLAMAGASANHA